jgi:hypothetical protein
MLKQLASMKKVEVQAKVEAEKKKSLIIAQL